MGHKPSDLLIQAAEIVSEANQTLTAFRVANRLNGEKDNPELFDPVSERLEKIEKQLRDMAIS